VHNFWTTEDGANVQGSGSVIAQESVDQKWFIFEYPDATILY